MTRLKKCWDIRPIIEKYNEKTAEKNKAQVILLVLYVRSTKNIAIKLK